MNGKWRIINEGEYSEAMHHALDKVMVEEMNEGDIRPTLRFWHRPHTSIPIGRFQSYHDEVEHEFIEENDDHHNSNDNRADIGNDNIKKLVSPRASKMFVPLFNLIGRAMCAPAIGHKNRNEKSTEGQTNV